VTAELPDDPNRGAADTQARRSAQQPSDVTSGRAWLPPRVRVRLVFAGKAFVVTSLLAAAGVLIIGSQRHKSSQPRHMVDLAVWRVLERPAWSTVADIREIRASCGLVGRGLPLYDRSAADLAREALVATPRAKRVVSVRRVPPDQVEVVLEMRRPVAAVALADGRYVEVDAEGIVLDEPSRERPVRGDVPLRVVSGSQSPLPPAGGECASDVRDGLRLCALLDAYREGLGEQTLRRFDEVETSATTADASIRQRPSCCCALPPPVPPRRRRRRPGAARSPPPSSGDDWERSTANRPSRRRR